MCGAMHGRTCGTTAAPTLLHAYLHCLHAHSLAQPTAVTIVHEQSGCWLASATGATGPALTARFELHCSCHQCRASVVSSSAPCPAPRCLTAQPCGLGPTQLAATARSASAPRSGNLHLCAAATAHIMPRPLPLCLLHNHCLHAAAAAVAQASHTSPSGMSACHHAMRPTRSTSMSHSGMRGAKPRIQAHAAGRSSLLHTCRRRRRLSCAR